jgi:hypothetical protein
VRTLEKIRRALEAAGAELLRRAFRRITDAYLSLISIGAYFGFVARLVP